MQTYSNLVLNGIYQTLPVEPAKLFITAVILFIGLAPGMPVLETGARSEGRKSAQPKKYRPDYFFRKFYSKLIR